MMQGFAFKIFVFTIHGQHILSDVKTQVVVDGVDTAADLIP